MTVDHIVRSLAETVDTQIDFEQTRPLTNLHKVLVRQHGSSTQFNPSITGQTIFETIQYGRGKDVSPFMHETFTKFLDINEGWLTFTDKPARGRNSTYQGQVTTMMSAIVKNLEVSSKDLASASTSLPALVKAVEGIRHGQQFDAYMDKWAKLTSDERLHVIVHLRDLLSLRLAVENLAGWKKSKYKVNADESQKTALDQLFEEHIRPARAQTLGYSNLLYILSKEWVQDYKPATTINRATRNNVYSRKEADITDYAEAFKLGHDTKLAETIPTLYAKKRKLRLPRAAGMFLSGVFGAGLGLASMFVVRAQPESPFIVNPPSQQGETRYLADMNLGSFGERAALAIDHALAERTIVQQAQVEQVTTAAEVTIDANSHIRFDQTLYPTLESMPPETRTFFEGKVNEISGFYNVEPGLILGLLKAENMNGGWRVYQPEVSSAGAEGIGQIVPATWNGWAGENYQTFETNMQMIIQNGGIGMDWSQRELIARYRDLHYRVNNQSDRSATTIQEYQAVGEELKANSNADASIFENQIAAMAEHFRQQGVTYDTQIADPQGYEDRIFNAGCVYNSGRTCIEVDGWVQSSANPTEVHTYAAWLQATNQNYRERQGLATPSTTVPLTSIGQAQTAENNTVAIGQSTNEITGSQRLTPEQAVIQSVTDSLIRRHDSFFGTRITEQQLTIWKTKYPLYYDSAARGEIGTEAAAEAMMSQIISDSLSQGASQIERGEAPVWPHIWNNESYITQKNAVTILGHVLQYDELNNLLIKHSGNLQAINAELTARPDAQIYLAARIQFDALLQRTPRGQSILHGDVWSQLGTLLSGYTQESLATSEVQKLVMERFTSAIKSSAEYHELHPELFSNGAADGKFSAMPLNPMDTSINRGFGAPVDYQVGGTHTGIDVATANADGSEPAIFAVDSGTVVHVGPLYCDEAGKCRGPHAVVIDHGNHVYTIYSHNSEANVAVGQQVAPGQAIARQGNLGYSFGSHLHFEVHTGAPFSGDWTVPFKYGDFQDPMEWLPN